MAWTLDRKRLPALAFSERLAEAPWIGHGITLRGSAVDPVNCSFSTSQEWERVREDRRKICERLGFPYEALTVPAQVHGAGIALVGERDRGRGSLSPQDAIADCDALVTNTRGILLGITTADCLPVLVVDPVQEAIGLAHSGWRGTAGRIVPRMLESMARTFGTQPHTCIAVIGPGIGPDGYEVDQKVYDAFPGEERNAAGVFAPTRLGHWSLDLTAAVLLQLRRSGLSDAQIEAAPWRTDRDTELFFSHRLAPGCPRMGAFLGLRPSPPESG